MTSTLLDRWQRLLGLVMITTLAVSTGAWLVPVPVPAGAAPSSMITWSTVSPPAAPPPLTYASMAYDSDNGTVVLFGGQRADGTLSSDTWVWNGSTWTQMTSPVPARQLATMAFDPALHQLILFGGQGSNGQLLNDTWAWNGASWYQQAQGPGAAAPPAREGATLAFDADDQLVLFGGTTIVSTPAATAGMAASTAPGASPVLPAATTSPAAAALGDTWVWTGSVWSQQSVTGPPARSDASMAWDPATHQTVLFGGSSAPVGTNPPTGMLGDTWVWGAGAWSQAAPAASPEPRQDAVLVADDDLGGLVAFGGSTATGPTADTWLWNGQTWTQVTPTNSPTPREGAAAAYDSVAHQLVLFGGKTAAGAVLGDTEILTNQAPTQVGGTTTEPAAHGTSTSTSGSALTRAPGQKGAAAASPGKHGSATTAPATRSTNSTVRQVRRGDLVTLSGAGFRPGAKITITFHSTPFLVGLTAANADGDFSATVAVPTAASAGIHHFEAVGLGVAGAMISVITPVRVIAAIIHHSTLVQTLVLVVVAVALPVGTWLVMVLTSRRRRFPLVT